MLKEHIIVENKNEYMLFNQYYIRKYDDYCELTNQLSDAEYVFSHLKYAVTWATLDKNNKVSQSKRVLFLDSILTGIEVNIKIHTKLFKKSTNEDAKTLYHSKYIEDIVKKKKVTAELDQFMNEAKTQQIRKFASSSYK
jgi:hypothetical protein